MNYPTPDKPKRKVGRYVVLGIFAIVLLFVVATCASNAGTVPVPDTDSDNTETAAPEYRDENGLLVVFGNGTYRVGTDVAAGEYRSPAPENSIAPLCYFAVKTGEEISDQGVANEGPSLVTLADGQTFESSGCQDWTRSE